MKYSLLFYKIFYLSIVISIPLNNDLPFLKKQCIAKKMIDAGLGGSIVNISSQASKVALMDHAVYCNLNLHFFPV